MAAKLASLSTVLGATQDQGMSFITSTTFSAVSSVSVEGCFTELFDNYLIQIVHTSSGGPNTTLRVRTAGADSSANYNSQRAWLGGTYQSGTSTAEFMIGLMNPTLNVCNISIFRPALAVATGLSSVSSSGAGTQTYCGSGEHTLTTAYSGFSYICSTGTITGTLWVYGYRKA